MALLAPIALASGCRDASPPEERVPSAVLTQSVSAAPTAATARPRRPAPQEPPSPLVEFDGLVQFEHKPRMVLKEKNPWLIPRQGESALPLAIEKQVVLGGRKIFT